MLVTPNRTAFESPVRPPDRDTIRDFVDHLQAAGKSRKTVETYREAAQALAAFTARKGMPLLERHQRARGADGKSAIAVAAGRIGGRHTGEPHGGGSAWGLRLALLCPPRSAYAACRQGIAVNYE